MAILLGESLLGVGDEVVVDFVGHEVDGAAAEATAHYARAGDAVFAGYVVEEVELLAAHLIVLGEATVCLVHLFTHGLVVTLQQGVADGQHAVFLLDNIFCTEVIFGGDFTLHGVEHLHVGVAQCFHAESLGHTFAGFAAAVVGGVLQLVLDY